MKTATIDLGTMKQVFQAHGADKSGKVVGDANGGGAKLPGSLPGWSRAW